MRFGRWRRALAVTAVISIAIAASITSRPERMQIFAEQADVRAQTAVSIPHPAVHPVPSVDGAQNPALIPDDIAFSLFFGSLRRTNAPYADRRRRSVARSVFSADAADGPAGSTHEHADITDAMNALLAFVDSYTSSFQALERQRLKDASQSVAARQRELVHEMMDALPRALGDSRAGRVQRYVGESVKRRIRVFDN